MWENMKGLLALPDDPNQRAAAKQGLLGFGAALLGGRGDFGGILGDGLMAGAHGYQSGLQQQQQQQLMATQQKRWDLENRETQAKLDEPAQFAQIMSGFGGSNPSAQESGALSGVPQMSMPGAAGSQPARGPIQARSKEQQYAEAMEAYRRYTAAGRPDVAKIYFGIAKDLSPKLKEQRALTVDGRRVIANVYDDGRTEQVEGFAPDLEKLHFANTGGATVGLDAFNGQQVSSVRNTQSPDSAASVAVQKRGQDIQAATAAKTNAKAPPGYRWAANGTLEPIPGGPASKAATSTEGERKAATLLMRLQGSEKQLEEALATDPSAAKPGFVAQGLRSLGAETLANSAAVGEARQRVEAAQLDILDSALTLGTGAAYTREQLESYRKSYFPQLGDSPKTVADKHARLQNVIEAAKIAAGRAAAGAEEATANTIKSVKDLPKKQAAAQAYADPEKERRYQEWKRSQGQ